jgi:hypothetical protein
MSGVDICVVMGLRMFKVEHVSLEGSGWGKEMASNRCRIHLGGFPLAST